MWKMTFTASAGVHVKSSMLKYIPIYYLHYKSVILNGNGKQASNNSGAQVIYLPLDIHTGRACSCRVSCCSGTCHEDNKWHGSFIYLQRISLSIYIYISISGWSERLSQWQHMPPHTQYCRAQQSSKTWAQHWSFALSTQHHRFLQHSSIPHSDDQAATMLFVNVRVTWFSCHTERGVLFKGEVHDCIQASLNSKQTMSLCTSSSFPWVGICVAFLFAACSLLPSLYFTMINRAHCMLVVLPNIWV